MAEDFYCGKRKGFKSTQLVPNRENKLTEVQTIYGFKMFVDNTDRTVSFNIARLGTW